VKSYCGLLVKFSLSCRSWTPSFGENHRTHEHEIWRQQTRNI